MKTREENLKAQPNAPRSNIESPEQHRQERESYDEDFGNRKGYAGVQPGEKKYVSPAIEEDEDLEGDEDSDFDTGSEEDEDIQAH